MTMDIRAAIQKLIDEQKLCVGIRLPNGKTKTAPAFIVTQDKTRTKLVVYADESAFDLPDFVPDLPSPKPQGKK